MNNKKKRHSNRLASLNGVENSTFHRLLTVWLLALVLGPFSNAAATPPSTYPDFKVAGVIGASYENGAAPEGDPLYGRWYLGGNYKTWVDHIAVLNNSDVHWLNYAQGGSVSDQGNERLAALLDDTLWPNDQGELTSRLSLLVIGFWGNDILWAPYDAAAVSTLLDNVRDQIDMAKSAGVGTLIVAGWPRWEDLDLDKFLASFPGVTTHIDETGYEMVRQQYYTAFSGPNPDYLFVDPWCKLDSFDGLHPDYESSKHAATAINTSVRTHAVHVGDGGEPSCH